MGLGLDLENCNVVMGTSLDVGRTLSVDPTCRRLDHSEIDHTFLDHDGEHLKLS